MVSHVTSLISTVCDTLEEYFLDQFSPWKIITLSVAITVTVKMKITGVSILKSSPKPTSVSDNMFRNLHTFLSLSVYIAIHSVTPTSFWQQMPAGHVLVICWRKIKDFYMIEKIVCSHLFKKSTFSANHFHLQAEIHIFLLYHWHYL